MLTHNFNNSEALMNHCDLVTETLNQFTSEQLGQNYIDSSLDVADQEIMTLESHIKNCSGDWLFRSYNISCDCRNASSLEDMMDYINLTLEKK